MSFMTNGWMTGKTISNVYPPLLSFFGRHAVFMTRIQVVADPFTNYLSIVARLYLKPSQARTDTRAVVEGKPCPEEV